MKRLLPLAASLLVAGTPALAQGPTLSNTTGFNIGLSLNGTSIDGKDVTSGRESGAGIGLSLGYGFTRGFSLVLDGTAAAMKDDWVLSHGDFLGRWTFGGPASAARPFIEGGFTTWMGTQEDVQLDPADPASRGDLEISGTAFTLGAGVHYFLNPKWALNGNLRFSTGEFDDVKFQNVTVSGLNADATSARLMLGVTWFPMAAR